MKELGADGVRSGGAVPGPQAFPPALLSMAGQSRHLAELTWSYRANALLDAHRDDPEFRYRFLAGEAEQVAESMCEPAAWRIFRDNGWWSAFGKK